MEGKTILLEIPKNNIYNNDPVNPKGNGSGKKQDSKTRNLVIALIFLVLIIFVTLVTFYPEEKVVNSPKMTDVDGNILIRSQLEAYQKQCKNPFEPSTIQKIFPFLFNENSENNIDKNANCEKIKLYISIFEDLKEGKIDSLRGLDYLRDSLGPADLIDTLNKGQKIKNYTAIKDTIDLDAILIFLRPPVIGEQTTPSESKQTKEPADSTNKPKENKSKSDVNTVTNNKKKEKLLEDDFWTLVCSNNLDTDSFKALFIKYRETNDSNSYIQFYKDYEDWNKFRKLKAIDPDDRCKTKGNLNSLITLIKEKENEDN
jgi:hypothetical protein